MINIENYIIINQNPFFLKCLSRLIGSILRILLEFRFFYLFFDNKPGLDCFHELLKYLLN